MLSKSAVDKHANPIQVACSMFAFAYRVRTRNLPGGQSALQFTRAQMDRLGIGRELSEIPWGSKRVKLPPSSLPAKNR